jgi:hypothetical protein
MNIEAFEWYDLNLPISIKNIEKFALELQNKGYGNVIYKDCFIEVYSLD